MHLEVLKVHALPPCTATLITCVCDSKIQKSDRRAKGEAKAAGRQKKRRKKKEA